MNIGPVQIPAQSLKNELPRAERNARQFINLPGDHEDLDKWNQIKADIESEQIWSDKIVLFWEKNRAVPPAPALSFAGRYGPLSNSSEKSTNPNYDKIKFAILSFPFVQRNAMQSPDGAWLNTVHEHRNCPKVDSSCKRYEHIRIDFSTAPNGTITAVGAGVVMTGNLVGTTFAFKMTMDGTYHGTGKFTFSSDFRSFDGTFESPPDRGGHRGVWSGRR